MCFHIYTHGAQNLDVLDVLPQKHGNAHVYPHESTQMARERDSVSSSHHHRAWKRVCVRNVFCVSSRLKSVAVFLFKLTRIAALARHSPHFQGQKLRRRHATGKTELARITKQIGNKLQNSTQN